MSYVVHTNYNTLLKKKLHFFLQLFKVEHKNETHK